MYRILVYLYALIGMLIILYNYKMPQYYIAFVIFFMFKWIFNYRKCTISFLECKLRGVKKENGYLYNFLEGIINLRYTKEIVVFLILGSIMLYYFFIIQKSTIII